MAALIVFSPNLAFARVTPEDIINSQREDYSNKLNSYYPENKAKIEKLSWDLANLNQEKTSYLAYLLTRQGEILDEYVKRKGIKEDGGKDGINRSQDPVAVTRLEITRAHEAVAYQAGKVYIINLTSQANIKQDSLNSIGKLQTDLNYVRNYTIKTSQMLNNLLKND